jgi:NAD dependent epimerase/dehydratase
MGRKNKYQGKKILVTGGGGFIGSHLVEHLVREGAEVTALTHYNGAGSMGWIKDLSQEIQSEIQVVLGDITDTEAVAALTEHKDTVFNLAALIAIPFSYKSPRLYLETNLMGTLNILEAARRSSSRVIHVSTSEVYGTPDTTPILETHPIKPQSPYAASKAAADSLCHSYFNSFDLEVVVVRPFNTFGPRQSTRAIIPTLLSQVLTNPKVVRVGSLDPVRDFTYVTDTVRALALAGTAEGITGETIQLGTGEITSVGNLLSICKEVFNVDFDIQVENERKRPKNSEVMILHSNPAKAKELLGWQSEITLKEGIANTAKWVRLQPSYLNSPGKYHV